MYYELNHIIKINMKASTATSSSTTEPTKELILKRLIKDPHVCLKHCIFTNDDSLMEFVLREYFIDYDTQELIEFEEKYDFELVTKVFKKMKFKQNALHKILTDIAQVMTTVNIVMYVLSDIDNLEYMCLSTNNKETIQKYILDFIKKAKS